jgi:isoquinoline 1-oxidoreductase beta subunit
MLIETAAKRWNVNKADCFAENGFVVYKPDGKKIGYGDLVEEASKMEPLKNVKLKNRSEYKIIGKPLRRQDTPSKVNGTAEFGQDKKVKGMLYAMVERNPRFHGKVKSFDDSAARKVAGVKHVFKVQMPVFASTREGVVVVADTLWAAMQGRKALKVEWDDSGFEHLSTDQLYARMRDDLKKTGLSQRTGGNPCCCL